MFSNSRKSYTRRYQIYNENICKSRIENWTYHDLVMVYQKCMFVDFLIGYTGPPNLCSLLSVEQL